MHILGKLYLKSGVRCWRTMTFVMGILAAGFLLYAGIVSKELLSYQVDNPPIVPFHSGRCPDRGLVAHWKFDELIDETASDVSGNGNIAVVGRGFNPFARFLSGQPKIAPGHIGNSVELERKQWFLAENSSCFATDEVSVMAWVWMESSTYVPTILAKSSWPLDGWWLCTTTNPPQSKSRFLDLGIAWGSGVTHVESGYQLPLREWHHVAVTMDNLQHEVQFYIDGKPFGQKHTNVHPWTVNFRSNLVVGAYDSAGRWPWHGKLDDMRIYNRVASEAEIKAAYQEGV